MLDLNVTLFFFFIQTGRERNRIGKKLEKKESEREEERGRRWRKRIKERRKTGLSWKVRKLSGLTIHLSAGVAADITTQERKKKKKEGKEKREKKKKRSRKEEKGENTIFIPFYKSNY